VGIPRDPREFPRVAHLYVVSAGGDVTVAAAAAGKDDAVDRDVKW